jgi:hypothetical protein
MKTKLMAAIMGFIFVIPGSVFAQEWTPQQALMREKKSEYSPYVGNYFPQRVYFGDTHHHSSYSFDSGMFGNTLGPEESFRFARGEEAPAGKSPVFMVRALRDVDGANLDRVQIIKGWWDAGGQMQEKVYDVAVSDGRTIGPDGRSKTPVGSTVDIADASYTNSIGDALLMGYWEDPDFDAGQRAFYYVRVIEIPTPRWTTYDAKRFGIRLPDAVRMTVQDRAYTSPIWYSP